MKYNTHYHPHHIDRLHELQGKPLASFWQRAMAFVIDIVVCTIIFIIILIIFVLIKAAYYGVRTVNVDFTVGDEVFNIILELIIPIIYFGILVYVTQGKTVGKWIMGTRIVSITHERISFIHSAERAMAYSTSILEFGFGFLQYFMNVNHRTLGDKVGETIVIRDRIRKKEIATPLVIAEQKIEESEEAKVQLEPLLEDEELAEA